MKTSLIRSLRITMLTISIFGWSFSAFAQPPNNDCANAIAITVHSIADCPANAITVNNTTATESNEATPSCENGNQGYQDVFFTFVAPTSGEINFSTPSISSPTVEGAIKNACGGTEIYCQNQGGGGIDGNTVGGLIPGVTYLLQLWTTNGGGEFEVCITATPPPPPPNDDCASAETISCGQTLSGSTTSASPDASCVDFTVPTNGVWYTFIGANSGDPGAAFGSPGDQVTMSTCGQADYDSKITMFTEGCAGLICQGGNDDVDGCANFTSIYSFPTAVGETYHLLISGFGPNDFGDFDLTMSCAPPCLPIPANDVCASAQSLNVDPFGSLVMTESTNECVPSSFLAPSCELFGNKQDVWFSFNSGIFDNVTIYTNELTMTNLGYVIYNGCGATEVSCQTDPVVSPLNISVNPGTDYFIAVYTNVYTDGPFAAGSFEIGIEGPEPVPCNEDVVLEINTDSGGSEISWEITPDGSSTVLCSGSGYPDNAQIFENCCLSVGCFELVFMDSFGDGIMPPGGYILRDDNGSRIIDANGQYTNTSSVGRPFCLPLGTNKILDVQCDKEDFLISDYMIASENPAVSAEFGGPNEANSGYQFWMFDPHGTYNRRVFFSHANPTTGAQPGPLAAGYLSFQNLQTLPVPTDLDLNVRVRSRIAGTNSSFGPACKLKVLSAPLTCPTTQLVDDLSNPNHSCNTIQTFGGSDKVVAWVVPGANFYRFRFVTDAGGWIRNIAGPTNARILNWNTLPLQNGQVYDVSVAVSFDGGANYCPFGPVCTVEIINPPSASSRSTEAENLGVNIWPNPNNGDLVYLTVDEIAADIDQVFIEIFDMFGKRVLNNSIASQGNSLNSMIDLNNDLSDGIYIMNVIVGDKVMTQRLIIQ